MPALRSQRLVLASEGREGRLPESRPGADQADGSAQLRISAAQSRELPGLQVGNPERRGHEVVDDADPRDSDL